MMQIEIYNQFCEAAMLNNCNWIRRREAGKIYANFMIVNSSKDTWYNDFIGVEFLGEMWISKYEIQVYPVRLTNTIVYHGRCLKYENLMMI